jgi:hypothetical protein
MFTFGRGKINKEICAVVDDYKKQRDNFMVDDVFESAKKNIMRVPEKDIISSMREDNITAEHAALNMIINTAIPRIESGEGIARKGAYFPDAQARISLVHWLFSIMKEKGYYSDEEYQNAETYLKSVLDNFG